MNSLTTAELEGRAVICQEFDLSVKGPNGGYLTGYPTAASNGHAIARRAKGQIEADALLAVALGAPADEVRVMRRDDLNRAADESPAPVML